MPQFTERALGELLDRSNREYATQRANLALWHALVYRRKDHSKTAMGTFMPKPFDQSRMILEYHSSRLTHAANDITNRLTENTPVIQVHRPPDVSGRSALALQDEEDALNAILHESGIPEIHQETIAWGQAVDGAGWYLTLPWDAAFGLPDRRYFEDLDQEAVQKLLDAGTAVLSRDPQDGELKPAESADLWIRRRKDASEAMIHDGRTAFHVEAIAHGSVMEKLDATGRAIGIVVEEINADGLGPQSDLSKMAAAYRKHSDLAETGLMADDQGNIVAGILKGGVPGETYNPGVTLARIFTRSELYYYLFSKGSPGGGMIVWQSPHNLRRVPLEVCPAIRTGSDRPDERYLPLLHGEYGFTPLINQAATLLSNVAVWNATPRFVIEDTAGNLIPEAETGQPKVIEFTDLLGMSPDQVAVIHGGRVKQLRIEDTETLLRILEFYIGQELPVLPSESETGGGALSASAWSRRDALKAATASYRRAILAHAAAVRRMASEIWVPQLQLLGGTIVFYSKPTRQTDGTRNRHRIELDTSQLTRDIGVSQTTETADERVSLRAQGMALRAAGRIDDSQMYEEFFLDPNPVKRILAVMIQRVFDAVMMGPTDQIPQGSLLFDIAQSIRGEVDARLVQESPAFVRALAERAVQQQGQQQPPQLPQPPQPPQLPQGQQGADTFTRGLGGPVNDAAGIRAPGLGAPVTQAPLPPLASFAQGAPNGL